MISIFKFSDGYYAVGEEGARRTFVPTWEQVLDYLDKCSTPHQDLKKELPRIRNMNKTLAEHFQGK